MLSALCLAALVSALLAIRADWHETKPPVFLLLKPLTTVLIAGIALLAPDSGYRSLLLLGLLLSLAGDICLMFEGRRWFLGGLGSFLLAHVVFVVAFLDGVALSGTPPFWTAAIPLFGIAMAMALVPRAGSLALPVLVYATVLMAMVYTAALRQAAIGGSGALLALAGAMIFAVSDSALGARKFIGPYRGAQGVILSTYWLAIGLIALSAHSVAGQ